MGRYARCSERRFAAFVAACVAVAEFYAALYSGREPWTMAVSRIMARYASEVEDAMSAFQRFVPGPMRAEYMVVDAEVDAAMAAIKAQVRADMKLRSESEG